MIQNVLFATIKFLFLDIKQWDNGISKDTYVVIVIQKN